MVYEYNMKVTTTWTGGRAFTAVGDSGYEISMDATEAYGGLEKGAIHTEMFTRRLHRDLCVNDSTPLSG